MENIYSIKFIHQLAPQYTNCRLEGVDEFLKSYLKILKDDRTEPIFSRTTKYKSFPHKQHYRVKRHNHIIIKGANAWRPFVPTSNIEKVKRTICRTLNKITMQNTRVVSDKLLTEIQKFKSIEVLDILAVEIHKKILYDKHYYAVYASLCSKIWGLSKWHDQLVTIVEDGAKLFWCYNYNEEQSEIKLNGPFKNEIELRKDSRNKVNFRFGLLNLLQKEFSNRDHYAQDVDIAVGENDRYSAKRRVFSPVEFIAILFINHRSVISEKIIHTIMLQLMEDGDKDLSIETLINMWKVLGPSPFHSDYIIQYFAHFKKITLKYKLCNRIRFMVEDLCKSYTKLVISTSKSWANVAKTTNMNTQNNINTQNNLNTQNNRNTQNNLNTQNNGTKIDFSYETIEENIQKYLKDEDIDIETVHKYPTNELIEIVLFLALEKSEDLNKLLHFFKMINISKGQIINIIDTTFVKNMDDIIIDIPRAVELLENIRSNL